MKKYELYKHINIKIQKYTNIQTIKTQIAI